MLILAITFVVLGAATGSGLLLGIGALFAFLELRKERA
jgi:hypothetical protein